MYPANTVWQVLGSSLGRILPFLGKAELKIPLKLLNWQVNLELQASYLPKKGSSFAARQAKPNSFLNAASESWILSWIPASLLLLESLVSAQSAVFWVPSVIVGWLHIPAQIRVYHLKVKTRTFEHGHPLLQKTYQDCSLCGHVHMSLLFHRVLSPNAAKQPCICV